MWPEETVFKIQFLEAYVDYFAKPVQLAALKEAQVRFVRPKKFGQRRAPFAHEGVGNDDK